MRQKHPAIYEINTWLWLRELGLASAHRVTLASVPARTWDEIAAMGIDAVWLMGVWERSPAGIAIANRNANLVADFRRALPDFCPEDNVGSPYCVRRYVVDKHLGGREGLAAARAELARRGVDLVLDFVPNHLALDHPWVAAHPEYFIQGSPEDATNDPSSFVDMGGRVFACGRDPYFPAWQDVLQLNVFQPRLRQEVVETLSGIAGQCDGVRCDMAMLLITAVFERTWGHRAGEPPPAQYWDEVIGRVKASHPGFLFMAEAYWDLEWQLQQQGFDYCYDKRLYDRLEHEAAEDVRLHLSADRSYQERLVRFIENHDEARAASIFSGARARAAAVTVATIPGATLFHEGQFEGRTVRIPVFLRRRPAEPVDTQLQAFYRTLLKEASRSGEWQLCHRDGWPDNVSHQNLVAWCWRSAEEHQLIVVNLSDARSQGLVVLPWDELGGTAWQMTDLFTGTRYERGGDEMRTSGLYVDLPPWGFHVLTRWVPTGGQ